jgi:Tubulin-tyrosine ligase family
MCLDQLVADGASAGAQILNNDYDDDGGGLEEDDEMRAAAGEDDPECCDLEIDEEADFEGASDSEQNQHHRTHDEKGDRTSKSEKLQGGGMKKFIGEHAVSSTTAGGGGDRKPFRIEKKKSIATTQHSTVGTLQRKTSSKGSKKSKGPYNEGAEENKEWNNNEESQSNFTASDK